MFGTHKKRNPRDENSRTLLAKFDPKVLAEQDKE